MIEHTPEEIKNRLFNISKSINSFAMATFKYIVKLEKENEQFKEYNEDLKQSLDWANERESEYVNRIEELKGSLESLKDFINGGKK